MGDNKLKGRVAINHEAIDHAAFDLVGYYQEHVAKELSKEVNDGIKYILAHYIDNPFEDIVTMAGLKERNIISFVFDRYPPAPKFDLSDEKSVYLTMTSDFLGIRQGNMLIGIDGKRTQITETMEPYLRQEFVNYSGMEGTAEFYRPLFSLSGSPIVGF